MAAFGGHTEALRLLVDHGADIHATDSDEGTALYRAAYGGKRNKVADLGQPSSPFSPEGHAKAVQFLLGRGADVNSVDGTGWTALMMAMGAGHRGIVRLLLKAGAEVHAVDEKGMTALDWAKEWGHADVAEMLRQAGAED